MHANKQEKPQEDCNPLTLKCGFANLAKQRLYVALFQQIYNFFMFNFVY